MRYTDTAANSIQEGIMKETSVEEAARVVEALEVTPTETNITQMHVMLEAYCLFLKRNEEYEDLWEDYGWVDNLTHIRSKTMRLVRKFWREEPQDGAKGIDDAYDLVNYGIFFIRNFMHGSRWGRR